MPVLVQSRGGRNRTGCCWACLAEKIPEKLRIAKFFLSFFSKEMDQQHGINPTAFQFCSL